MIHPLISIAAVNGLIAVLLGAFTTHTLKESITEELLRTFQTGVTYHMYHSLAMLAVSMLSLHFPHVRVLKFSAYSFLLGIILFSGSLYFLALTEVRGIGIITPIGGIFFILGWIALCIFGAKPNFHK
tara:strand:- start:92 stop:475 length:384 start_codon:yes stop_codon:yes gene_type:complete